MRRVPLSMTRSDAPRWLRAGAFLVLGAFALINPVGCGPTRGPAEQVGHDIDQAAHDVDESVHEATH